LCSASSPHSTQLPGSSRKTGCYQRRTSRAAWTRAWPRPSWATGSGARRHPEWRSPHRALGRRSRVTRSASCHCLISESAGCGKCCFAMWTRTAPARRKTRALLARRPKFPAAGEARPILNSIHPSAYFLTAIDGSSGLFLTFTPQLVDPALPGQLCPQLRVLAPQRHQVLALILRVGDQPLAPGRHSAKPKPTPHYPRHVSGRIVEA